MVLASLLALSLLALPADAGAQPAFQLLHGFVDPARNPVSAPVQASDGSLYGTTLDGGSDFGAVYRIDSSGSFSVVHFFRGDDGDDPYAELTPASDGFLYGTTVLGGEANAGTIFRIEPATGAVITVHSFATTPPSGSFPYGRLTQGSDGFLYGTTAEGGVENLGAVYRLDPATGVVTSIHSFTTTAPSSWGPRAGLTQASNGFLYGTTLGGGGAMGLSSSGTVYRLHPATGEVTTLHAFTWMGPGKPVNPSPYAGLTQAGDGFLYGTTAFGGTHGTGSIYRLDPATDAVSTVYSFTAGEDGWVPFAGLTQASDGYLYGTTEHGGAANAGTVYRLDPATGAVTTVHSFPGTALGGGNPLAGVTRTPPASSTAPPLAATQPPGEPSFGSIQRTAP